MAQEWSSLPQRIERAADRFRGVMIECRPALDVIDRYQGEEVAIFADPPYPAVSVHGVRRRCYRHEMLKDEDHVPLLDALAVHRGPVVLCSYRNDLYDQRLLADGWEVVEFEVKAEHGADRVEAIYINPVAVAEAPRQLTMEGVK